MLNLKINGQSLSVAPGTTILEAAQSAGISIPTLCHFKGTPHFTSCMVCVVQDTRSGRLIPSCSARATEGMDIRTDTDATRAARTESLNLLMSEHAGDCVAPCTVTCPAHLDIPKMIRHIAAGNFDEALNTLHDAIALPAVTGRICPAPCEKACRRGRLDAPLSICLLERFAAEATTTRQAPSPASTSKRVAIIGAGPAGLAAAYYLSRTGHPCTIFDDRSEAGGQLRYGVSTDLLPGLLLDQDIQRIRQLGVQFHMNTRIGRDLSLQTLKIDYDAIVLATGKPTPDHPTLPGFQSTARGLTIDSRTFRTSDPQVFAGGEVVQPGHLAIRALAHGRSIAISIDQFLKDIPVTGPVQRFESRLGSITQAESHELLKEGDPRARTQPESGPGAGFARTEAIQESLRCMHCDCRKADACKLRDLMEIHLTGPLHIPASGRKPVTRNLTHPRVVFEPGKCIKCGICIRITTQAGESPGLTFLNRGFDVEVGVPFGDSFESALGPSAKACINACPTGALAWRMD